MEMAVIQMYIMPSTDHIEKENVKLLIPGILDVCFPGVRRSSQCKVPCVLYCMLCSRDIKADYLLTRAAWPCSNSAAARASRDVPFFAH